MRVFGFIGERQRRYQGYAVAESEPVEWSEHLVLELVDVVDEQYWHDSNGNIQFGLAVAPSANVKVPEAGALAPTHRRAMQGSRSGKQWHPSPADRSLQLKIPRYLISSQYHLSGHI